MDISEYKSLIVNDHPSDLTVNGKGEFIIKGSSTNDSPLKWELIK